ncbi:hypothetical protein ACFL5Q_07455, partial [Planctomycetota bacterium]
MKRQIGFRMLLFLSVAALIPCGPVQADTALEMLRQAPKPHCHEGHTLLPLTRWGWTMPFEVRVELAEHWGYALEFGGYATDRTVQQLDDPESMASKICALSTSDPKRYPLCVLTHRPFLDKTFRGQLPESA